MELVSRKRLNSLYKRDRLEYFLNGEILRVNEMNGDIGNLDYQNYPVVLNTIYEMFRSGRYPNIEKIFEDKLFLLLEIDDYYGQVDKVDVYSAMNLIYLQPQIASANWTPHINKICSAQAGLFFHTASAAGAVKDAEGKAQPIP